MKIELEFFEYPKHKPAIQEWAAIQVLVITNIPQHLGIAQPMIYEPATKYVFSLGTRLNYEPYVTHWAYLPQKPKDVEEYIDKEVAYIIKKEFNKVDSEIELIDAIVK